MAASFTPNKRYENDPNDARTLLQKDISHSGYLMRKHKYLTFNRWIRSYVIIHQSEIYIYETPTSHKPLLVCSMFGYDRIYCQGKALSKSQPWTFAIAPMVSTMATVTFGASSKTERDKWMLEIKIALLQAHKMFHGPVRKRSLHLRRQSDISQETEFIQEPVFKDEQQINEMRDSLKKLSKDHPFDIFDNNQGVYDEIKDDVPTCDSPVHDAPEEEEKYENVHPSDNKSFYENAMFYGDKESSLTELHRRSGEGVFLVRKHEGRTVLSVKVKSIIVKFEVEIADENVRLKNSSVSFASLPQLLTYYMTNDLPKGNNRLTTPFQLAQKVE